MLSDQLPTGVTFVSEDLGGGVYDRGANAVTWHLGTVSSGPVAGGPST